MKEKIIGNKDFIKILEKISIPDIFYIDRDLLQFSYKDITRKTLLFSSTNGSTINTKAGGSILGVVTIEGGVEETTQTEFIYSPKDLFIQIFNDKKYLEHLQVLKVRLTDVNWGSLKSKVFRTLSNENPRKYEERAKNKKDSLDNEYVHIEEKYTSGLLKDYIFNEESFWRLTKPDVDADDFYLICLKSISFDKVRDLSEESRFYDLICPLAILRIRENDIKIYE